MASRKRVVTQEGESPDTTLPPYTPGGSTGEGGGAEASPEYQAYMQQVLNDAWVALKKMDLAKRLKTLQLLRRKGFGPDAEVSATGLALADIYRYQELLVYQQAAKDLTIDQAFGQVNQMVDKVVSSAAKRRTNIKDVDAVFSQVVSEMIGRQPTQDELSRFRAAYSGMEAGGNAPNIQVAAQAQVEQKMTEENQASQFAQYAGVFEQMLRGA